MARVLCEKQKPECCKLCYGINYQFSFDFNDFTLPIVLDCRADIN